MIDFNILLADTRDLLALVLTVVASVVTFFTGLSLYKMVAMTKTEKERYARYVEKGRGNDT